MCRNSWEGRESTALGQLAGGHLVFALGDRKDERQELDLARKRAYK